jgi:hypothetical protein
MEIETLTFIEVENEPFVWAVELSECKGRMEPVTPMFISVCNTYNGDKLNYVYHILTDKRPEKTIEDITGSISDDYKEVGFWIIKHKKPC